MATGRLAQRLRGGWWEELYSGAQEYEIPWEAGRPSSELVALVEGGEVKPGLALDLGCGLGTNAIYLTQQGFRVWGLDIAPSALRRASRRARQAGASVAWLEGDARSLPFASGSLDFLYDRGCLHHQQGAGPLAYAAEVARVLRPGGRYQLLAFTSRFRPDELDSLFRRDFRVLRQGLAYFLERSGSLREFHSLFLERR